MGRGRQKAKATKQARDIKYYSPATDYSALQRELAGSSGHGGDAPSDAVEGDGVDTLDDSYADGHTDEGSRSRRFG